MSGVYYNEFEPYCVEWLKNLIRAGLIPDGDVDSRSIVDVQPEDIRGYTQHHFFAGLGGWPLALRLAGWADDRPIVTGSAPCQPFSVAGRQRGTDDDRHLWPHYFRLIDALGPDVAVGEQVSAAIGKNWLDGVFADLEGAGYACEAHVLPACSVNAPHRRDRIVFVALRGALGDCLRPGLEGHAGDVDGWPRWAGEDRPVAEAGCSGDVADAQDARERWRGVCGPGQGVAANEEWTSGEPSGRGEGSHVADAGSERRQQVAGSPHGDEGPHEGWPAQVHHVAAGNGESGGCNVADRDEHGRGTGVWNGQTAGHGSATTAARGTDAWRHCDWIIGHDGKARRIPTGAVPVLRGVVDGLPASLAGVCAGRDAEEIQSQVIALLESGVLARTGKLKALGNAIVPQVCAEFIGALMECLP